MHRHAGIAALLLVVTSLAIAAQTGKYKLGKPATPQQIRAFDISISPSGAGLPAGEGNAQRRRQIYIDRFSACHGMKGEGGPGSPALAGGIGTLKSAEPLQTVGSFWPYSTTVY